MTKHKLEGSPSCPSCGKLVDGYTNSDRSEPDATPSPGDFSVCFYCCEKLRYTDQLMVRVASDEELKSVGMLNQLNGMVASLRSFRLRVPHQ